jgi:protocatechuate 4,5-dioxygenase beta chain
VESFDDALRVVIIGTGGMSHQLTGPNFGWMNREADLDFLDRIETSPHDLCERTHEELMRSYGAEGIELIMWLVMRGALPSKVKRMHRSYYAPMTTGMGLITLVGAE